MKITYLMAGDGSWGGLEKHVFELASEMANRGHDVSVVAHNLYKDKASGNIRMIPFDWNRSRWNILMWLELKQLLKQIAPDIIHAHAAKAVKVLSKTGWPSSSKAVGTAHNLKSGYQEYKNMDGVIAVSSAIESLLKHANSITILNGIRSPILDAEKLATCQEWKSTHAGLLALGIGRLVPAKGFDLLLKTWPQNTSAQLVILGDGPERKALESIIHERRLNNIHLLGMSAAVAEWLHIADFLIISSRNEGGPYTLPEALLSNTPVISTNVGMVPDILPKTCIAEPNNAESLEKIIHYALDNVSWVASQNKESIHKAHEKLTIDAMVSKTEEFYISLL